MKKVVFTIMILAAIALAQPFSNVEVKTAEFPIQMGYTVELPPELDTARTYPLIVGIHGFGDRMSSYVGTAQSFCPDGAIGLYPESPYPFFNEDDESWGWTWWHWSDTTESYIISRDFTLEQSVRWIVAAIEEVKASYPVDPEKVFLYGFSQGGFLTFKVGLEYPHLFKGILPAGGWMEFDTLTPLVLDSAALELPVRILHGAYDNVVDYESALAAYDTLSQQGLPVELLSYPLKHSLSREVFEDCRDFCFSQLYEKDVQPLTDILWPDSEIETQEHIELLKQILCSTEPVADIEAGLLELYRGQESEDIKSYIIYLLGARRCTGAEMMLTEILNDTEKTQNLRNASYSALIKLGTEEAWDAVDAVEKQLVITRVVEGSQAESNGFQVGDVIYSYNGKRIKVYPDLREAIGTVKKDAKKVSMVLLREGERLKFKLEPGQIGIYPAEELK